MAYYLTCPFCGSNEASMTVWEVLFAVGLLIVMLCTAVAAIVLIIYLIRWLID